ncbi:NAD binding domain of 6-phosphogluconate dehydrogenase-domain-containing protein [Blastocladiella britannica]|nr:NAD binding domain of 6-phosphogluconate dehydrogenase-domain-containing protein [Blastocladiella britannica]
MLRSQLTTAALRSAARRSMATATKPLVIGFIGLGQMGSPMSANLLQKYRAANPSAAKSPFVVYDTVPAASAAFAASHANATAATSVAQVAAAADVVVTMLPTSAHVHDVYLGADGVLAHIKRGALLIDSSTIDPATVVTVANAAKAKGVDMVDAPVSGGILGAKDATLTFMVGGPQPLFDRATPLLKHMGRNIVHCGPWGKGQVAKICNNMVLGSTMVAVAEAMNLGIKHGMDAKALAGIMNTSSARCWSSDTYNPVPGVLEGVPASRDYAGGFGIRLLQKDMGLAIAAAEQAKVPVPMAAAADSLYKAAMNLEGVETKDMGIIYQFLSGGITKYIKKKQE